MAPPAWVVATGLLCGYGFLKELRPSEPYLTPYLTGPDKNLTEDQVNSQVYPVWTYSYLAALVPVFLLTDLLRYKPVIIFEACSYIITWSLLLWAQGVRAMQFMQFVYGFATATEIAYYAYIYAAVEPERYQHVTSYTRSTLLASRFFSALLGQILISTKVTNYFTLNCISFGSVCAALLVSVFIPSVSRSLYFHSTDVDTVTPEGATEHDPPANRDVRQDDGASNLYQGAEPNNIPEQIDGHVTSSNNKPGTVTTATRNCLSQNFGPLWTDFKQSYGNAYLLKWSIWWAIATCGNFQVGNYIQILFDHVDPNRQQPGVYNGAVDAAATLLGALVAFAMAFVKVNWSVFGELLLGVVSFVDAVLLLVMSQTRLIWITYIFYILFRASYQMVITIASFQIASQLKVQRYGLVFGCNTFIALALQTILTAVVVDKQGLHLSIRIQFVVNGSYFLLMGLIFLVNAIRNLYKLGLRRAWELRRGGNYVTMDE